MQDATPSITRTYRPASDVFANPERGFYYMLDCHNAIDPTQLSAWHEQEAVTLVLCSVDLGPFIESGIDAATLALFDQNMAAIRNAGMKAIVRFFYSSDTSGKDTTLQWIETHLEQIKPHLELNKDTIAVVQAGFIGGWGEWAYSLHFGTGLMPTLSAQNLADRKAVAEKLLATVPVERQVAIRYPAHKRHFYGTTPLSASEAFTGTARARMAHHNDCFLASDTDLGTYVDTATEYPYLASDSAYTVNGGETCYYNPPRSDCPTALTEMAMFHYSYLNNSFDQTVISNFKVQGCYSEINRRLGYRFVLDNGSLPLQAQPGQSFQIAFEVNNEGWATPFNRRDVELVLRNTASGVPYHIGLPVDPRFWLAGQKHVVRHTVMLPADMPEGTYEMLLNLPDPAPSLRGRPDFSIRFANEDTWEAATGFNRLNHIVRISNPSIGHAKGMRGRLAVRYPEQLRQASSIRSSKGKTAVHSSVRSRASHGKIHS